MKLEKINEMFVINNSKFVSLSKASERKSPVNFIISNYLTRNVKDKPRSTARFLYINFIFL